MKGIIFKLVIVFLITVIIASSFGYIIAQYSNTPGFTYTVNGVVQEDFNPKVLGFKVGLFMFLILTIVFLWFYVTNIIILTTTYKGTKKIENKNIVYQRDLADDYNSAIASYIVDGTVESKQDYKAVLVELETMGLIYRENGKYRVREKIENTEDLLMNQKVVLNQIKEGNINLKIFKNTVIQDARNLGYMQLNQKLLISLIILTFVFPVTIFLILYMILVAKPYINILTEKGRKEKDKILKLKTYLNNFSNIHDIESSDNNIWGEYLAYAISLKVNKKLKVKREDLI